MSPELTALMLRALIKDIDTESLLALFVSIETGMINASAGAETPTQSSPEHWALWLVVINREIARRK